MSIQSFIFNIEEIDLAGIAPDIAATVYQSTGVRVRKLPVRIENQL
jgi:CO/xanthine dehydrogenase Mo-binding subunit